MLKAVFFLETQEEPRTCNYTLEINESLRSEQKVKRF
jgi:hypothetical protein